MGFETPEREFSASQPVRGEVSVGSPHILLVVGGGIAAYKSCELVRLIRRAGARVTCVVTDGGQNFVTPLALAALSENPVYTNMFDLKDETEMGHIQLSRAADLVVVCPATADLLAKMAAGIADDLATTLILATDKPVMAVPAMNVRMWQHEATQRNVAWLAEAGVTVLDPDEGPMACGEYGPGRLPDPEFIWRAIAEATGIDHGLEEMDRAATPHEAGTIPAEEHPAYEEESDAGEDAGTPEEGEYAEDYPDDGLAAEALEPEPEEEVTRKSGLGSLLSAIIPRSTPRREPEEYEEAFEEGADDAPFDEEAADYQENTEGEEVADVPDLASPLLAKKGSASSAPPTDPDALNHMVRTGAGDAMPQPMAFEAGAAPRVTFEAPSTMAAAIALDPMAAAPVFSDDPDYRPLEGRHVLVTAGPTWEPLDPIRYLANRSSGRQGYAIAAMAAAAGARVTLVSGPVSLPTPPDVDRIDVESAAEMAAAVKKNLPADIAFMVAAVADWRPKTYSPEKMKKRGSAPPALMLTENPDILATVAGARNRPALLVGFAAETEKVVDHAKNKRKRKGADWIVANDVSGDVMGGDTNAIHIITSSAVESFDEMPKEDVARELVARAANALLSPEDPTQDD
jgi:phosphopantothenoylcysteine decarboxylase/phosphopantothenate--cysteine ligase